MILSAQTIFIIIFQQLPNQIKLETMRIFHKCLPEQNHFGTLPFRTQSRHKNLSPKIRKSVSYEIFKNLLLKFIRPSPNSLFNVSDSLRNKLLTRLRLGFNHFREHKRNPSFQE